MHAAPAGQMAGGRETLRGMNRVEAAELDERGVYRLNSRNLRVGVWVAARGGFLGIREKFGRRYLAFEALREQGGTATPLERLAEWDVPPGVALRESIGTVDSLECRRLRWEEPGWVYADSGLSVPEGVQAVTVGNGPLFSHLDDAQEDLEWEA